MHITEKVSSLGAHGRVRILDTHTWGVLDTRMCVSDTLISVSVQEQLLRRNIKRFRGGLVFKAHRRLYHSTPGWRVVTKKRRYQCEPQPYHAYIRARQRHISACHTEDSHVQNSGMARAIFQVKGSQPVEVFPPREKGEREATGHEPFEARERQQVMSHSKRERHHRLRAFRGEGQMEGYEP